MSVSQVASRNNSESLICWFASVAAQITFDKKPSKRIFMDCFKWSRVSIDCLADDSLELFLSSVNVYNKNTLSACYAVVIAGIFWCEQHLRVTVVHFRWFCILLKSTFKFNCQKHAWKCTDINNRSYSFPLLIYVGCVPRTSQNLAQLNLILRVLGRNPL